MVFVVMRYFDRVEIFKYFVFAMSFGLQSFRTLSSKTKKYSMVIRLRKIYQDFGIRTSFHRHSVIELYLFYLFIYLNDALGRFAL